MDCSFCIDAETRATNARVRWTTSWPSVAGLAARRRARSDVARTNRDELRAARLRAHGWDFAFVQLLSACPRSKGSSGSVSTSPHPRGFKQDLVEAMAAAEIMRLCAPADAVGQQPHPARDDRPYTRERYLEIVESLRAVRPTCISRRTSSWFSRRDGGGFRGNARSLRAGRTTTWPHFQILDPHGHPRRDPGHQIADEVKEARNATLLGCSSKIPCAALRR